jgi:integrase
LEASTTSKSWIYRYKSPATGKMRQVKIGEWPEKSLAAATVEWEQLRAQRADGRDPADEKRAERTQAREAREQARARAANRFTVGSLCDLYLRDHVDRNRAPKGAAEVRRMFSTMLGEFAELEPHEVTRVQAYDLIQSFAHIPVQAAKLKRELGAVWDHGHDSGKLDADVPNWWRQIMRGKLRSKGHIRDGIAIGTAKRVLTPDEIGQLIRWLPNFSRTIKDALTLYLWTCTRGSEIMAMKGSEIFEEADGLWWVIPKSKTKNARFEEATDLRVPLIGRAREVVLCRREQFGQGYIFPSPGKVGYVEQKTVGVAVWFHQPYAKTRPHMVRPRLPVTHWAPHDLRRTGRTQLAALGCGEEVAEAVLGHMPKGIAGVYNLHRYDKERREWLGKLSEHYENLVRSS